MKTSKAPENVAVTPPQKKLKQARLPFMLISDVSPKSSSPTTRKRKLSVSETEPSPKLGKKSKENDITENLVIISDDESKGSQELPKPPEKEEKLVNPYVKLVDTVLKKKQQKKTPKKKDKKSKKLANGCVENNGEKSREDMEVDDVDLVEVREESPEESEIMEDNESKKDLENKKDMQNMKLSDDKTNTESSKSVKINETIVSENKDSSSEKQKESHNKESHNKDLDTVIEEKEKNKQGKTTKINVLIPRSTPRHQIKNVKEPEPITNSESAKATHPTPNVTEVFTVEDSNSCSENSACDSKKDEEDKKDLNMKIVVSEHSEVITQNTESKNTNETMESHEKSPELPLEEKKDDKKVENHVTPKRSPRSRAAKKTNNLDTSNTSVKLDESVSSNPTTPKQKSRNSSATNSHGDQSLNESIPTANLTPKQMQKKLEAAKKREEREKEKLEKEKKRQQEKEERERQRKEKEDQKRREREEKEEQKKKEREEKEEQKRKEREEKEKQKEMERKLREMKEEQKRKEKEDKEEQRRKEKEAREEEKRKRQEALELEKQEQELKKKKAAEAFVSFFVPKQKVEKDHSEGPVSKSDVLSSFAIKSDMRLAPTCRVDLSDERRESLDKALDEQNLSENELYLKNLKNGIVKPMCSSKTWPLSDKDDDDDVLIVEDELPPIDSTGQIVTCEPAPREKLRPKLLSFHQNRRPPYWGTWRKKSPFIKPRRPFGQDQKQLDYEVDSDEEWEEDQDGESVDGSGAGSEDEGADDDYEVDHDVFVPHGYLSDEEATMEDDVLSLTPETQKARLKHLEDEFETELKKPTEKLKPRLYGLLWESSEGGKPENCVDALWNYFSKFSMILNDPTHLLQPSKEPEDGEKKKIKKKKLTTEGEEQSPKREKKKNKVEQKEIKKIESKKTGNQLELREMKEEQKRKEKEDKEEQRRKEKEAREEEKRKRQEALELEKQEQELKKKKAAEAFVSFFVPKQKVEKDHSEGPVSKSDVLSSFAIKSDMRLAPTCRVDLSDERRESLDKALDEQNLSENELYLKNLKNGILKPMCSSKTWPLSDKDDDDDVLIVEDELPPIDSTGQIVTCEPAPREKLRPKLLSFHQNRRPPYWGTWRKKSPFIKPRRPFGQDQKQLDYEVDSDEEWEEDQDGESVDGSGAGSEDEGADDDYEVDHDVFVPHGYLSDEEATMEDDVLSLTPETQKARLKHLEDEFESELKKPTEKLKPRLYGLLWESSERGKPENCVDALWNYFSKFSMILNDPTHLLQPSKEPEDGEKKKIKKKKLTTEGEEQSPKREKKKKKVEQKEIKKIESKKTGNQLGINTFLTKKKAT